MSSAAWIASASSAMIVHVREVYDVETTGGVCADDEVDLQSVTVFVTTLALITIGL